MFTREELQQIEKKALELANTQGTNSSWVRVYLRLADACSELDAYIARSSESGSEFNPHIEN